MGRLIDAEQAKLMLSELLEVAEKENFTAEDAISHAYEWLDNIPTAYDPEKVVAELEKEKAKSIYDSDSAIDVKSAYSKAIDIVKRGGVE